MRVTVRLFARLREIIGSAELARTVEPGATVGTLWRQLAQEHAALAQYERSISTAVNADYARMDRVLADGDEVAFLPPVSGGELDSSSEGPSAGRNGTSRFATAMKPAEQNEDRGRAPGTRGAGRNGTSRLASAMEPRGDRGRAPGVNNVR